MSIMNCERCDTFRDTDFSTDCKKCTEEMQSEFDQACANLEFDEAMEILESAFKYDIEIETNSEYQSWLSNEIWEQEQHEKGGCKDE